MLFAGSLHQGHAKISDICVHAHACKHTLTHARMHTCTCICKLISKRPLLRDARRTTIALCNLEPVLESVLAPVVDSIRESVLKSIPESVLGSVIESRPESIL